MTLSLVGQVDDGRSVLLSVRNETVSTVSLSASDFALILDDGTARFGDASGSSCEGAGVASEAAIKCFVHFYDPGSRQQRGIRVEFSRSGMTSSVDLPVSTCVGGDEATASSCNDGCDNDLDGFADCEDRDCCPFVVGCPAASYCARNPSEYESTEETCRDGIDNDHNGRKDCDDDQCCNLRKDCPSSSACGALQCWVGPEDTLAACTDGCSNDQDAYIDCDDRDCCEALASANHACPADTYCGR